MKIITVIEILGGLGVIWLYITQVVIPAWKEQPLFPWFIKKRKELQEKKAQANLDLENAQTQLKIENIGRKARTIRRKTREVRRWEE